MWILVLSFFFFLGTAHVLCCKLDTLNCSSFLNIFKKGSDMHLKFLGLCNLILKSLGKMGSVELVNFPKKIIPFVCLHNLESLISAQQVKLNTQIKLVFCGQNKNQNQQIWRINFPIIQECLLWLKLIFAISCELA